MNTETGQICRGEPVIQQAKERGEPIVPVSDRVARLMEEALTKEARRWAMVIVWRAWMERGPFHPSCRTVHFPDGRRRL